MASGRVPASGDEQLTLAPAVLAEADRQLAHNVETANATFPEETDAEPMTTPLSAFSWLTFINACCIFEGHAPDMPINIDETFAYVATTSLMIGKTSSTLAAAQYAASAMRRANWEVHMIEELVEKFDFS